MKLKEIIELLSIENVKQKEKALKAALGNQGKIELSDGIFESEIEKLNSFKDMFTPEELEFEVENFVKLSAVLHAKELTGVIGCFQDYLPRRGTVSESRQVFLIAPRPLPTNRTEQGTLAIVIRRIKAAEYKRSISDLVEQYRPKDNKNPGFFSVSSKVSTTSELELLCKTIDRIREHGDYSLNKPVETVDDLFELSGINNDSISFVESAVIEALRSYLENQLSNYLCKVSGVDL